jgi:EAL domain-containing protein (putative c-di-GMP-specific phosphodiesterase class I)
MDHECQCATTGRILGVVFGPIADDNEALADAAERFDWHWDRALGAAAVPVGPAARIRGPGELFDLLAGIVGTGAAGGIRATWLDSTDLQGQAGRLLRAGPLSDLAPEGDSPLAEMLDGDYIETWYQPILRATDASTWGYECLLRARDPQSGALVSPGQVLDWARQENLLFTLDRVCRETHTRNAGERARSEPEARFLINFLPTVIYQPEFCLRTTVKALEGTPLEPSQVIFEVVETEAVEDHDHLRGILDYYRRNGFGVALDDLTAGYSGLALMADLDPDVVKIDREVVRRSPGSEGHADVCRAIVAYARKRGRTVLAEGIETEAEADLMRSLGVDLLQGFYFGRPAP